MRGKAREISGGDHFSSLAVWIRWSVMQMPASCLKGVSREGSMVTQFESARESGRKGQRKRAGVKESGRERAEMKRERERSREREREREERLTPFSPLPRQHV